MLSVVFKEGLIANDDAVVIGEPIKDDLFEIVHILGTERHIIGDFS
jgi:hypothetical protein